MRIKNLIKHSLISIFTLSFILINNINIAFACGSPAMAGVHAILNEVSEGLRMPPLRLVCLLYSGCYNDMNAIEKYTNDIAKNLNNLKSKIGDAEFNKFWNHSAPSKKAIGEKLQEFLGLTIDSVEGKVVYNGKGTVLGKYKGMLGSAGIPPEDEAGYNKLREELEKVKELLAEKVMPLLGQAQGEVFAKLDKLDKEIGVSKEAINEFHKAEIEEHKKASEIQALCKSRIGLVKENLSDLLGDVEQGLTTLASIAPDNIEHSIEHIIWFSKVRQAVMNMSYITMPDYLSRSLDRRVRLREEEIKPKEGPVADIIKFQRGIGDLQTRISFLREPIIQLTIEPTIVQKKELHQEGECTSGKGGNKAKKSKAVIIDPYIPWQNPELATGISEKLYAYSLNQYHFLQKNASAGMDKAYEIWTSLGYINEDAGVLEARIRRTLIAPHNIKGHQNIKNDIYWGDAYIGLLEIVGTNLEKQTIMIAWEYKKIGETADNKIVLSSYPKCVTIYQKE